MAVIMKCKMCGGDLVLTESSTIATCEYCGTTQTIPSQDNEKKLIQFERAERLRRSCDFDKAAGVYENIVTDFRQEAEAYWGLVLCKYGIEYVDDPSTGKKVPTCHRSSFDSIMDDHDFELVLENADEVSRKLYREEAKQIEEIRKRIIEVSSNEPPYDIFICYKETDKNGERTLDSVLAQDIYNALSANGYRVFFSRISLEDKIGQAYEPYIFAALNSAKVMLAIGTDYEHYNAVWVKNEWSRFLKLMEQDTQRHLIPCFKGIDAYDIPKEFNKLQAQDMGKLGAMQDLLRGIDKLIATKSAPASGVQSEDVDRSFILHSAKEKLHTNSIPALEDAILKVRDLGNWQGANLLLADLEVRLAELNQSKKKAKHKKRVILCSVLGAIVLSVFCLWFLSQNSQYKAAQKQEAIANYTAAYRAYEKLGGFRNSKEQAAKMKSICDDTQNAFLSLLRISNPDEYCSAIFSIPEIGGALSLNYYGYGDYEWYPDINLDSVDAFSEEADAFFPSRKSMRLWYHADKEAFCLMTAYLPNDEVSELVGYITVNPDGTLTLWNDAGITFEMELIMVHYQNGETWQPESNSANDSEVIYITDWSYTTVDPTELFDQNATLFAGEYRHDGDLAYTLILEPVSPISTFLLIPELDIEETYLSSFVGQDALLIDANEIGDILIEAVDIEAGILHVDISTNSEASGIYTRS